MSTLLITGGAGSLGLTLCHLWKDKYDRIIAYSTDEAKHVNLPEWVTSEIGDIRDKDRLNHICNVYKVTDIVTAGALKRVDTLERFATEAYKTNVIGTHNIADAALNNGVKKCLLIGTDKLVNPCNTYGYSKALARAIFTEYSQYGLTKFSTVLYPNVIASRGSFVPLWRDKIKNREVIQVTDKRCSRFLFTLHDAVNLIERAMNVMEGGETVIPILSSYLVTDVAESIYQIVGGKLKIEYSGLRPGEKIHEAMCNQMELDKIYHIDDDTLTILPSINTGNTYTYKQKKYSGGVIDSQYFISKDIEQLKLLLIRGMDISPY